MKQTFGGGYTSGKLSQLGPHTMRGKILDVRLKRGSGEVCTSHWPCVLRSRLKESPGTVSWALDLKGPGVSKGEIPGPASLLPSLWSHCWVGEIWFSSHYCRTLECPTPHHSSSSSSSSSTPHPPLLPFLPLPHSAMGRPLAASGEGHSTAACCASVCPSSFLSSPG